MATVTATQATAAVPGHLLDEGQWAVTSTFVAFGDGVTLTAGTFVAMLKVPHDVTVLDGYVEASADNYDFAFGTSDDPDRFFATASAAVFTRFNIGLPYKFSATDQDTRRDIFAGIELGTGQNWSLTETLTMVCFLAKSVEYS